ncbi:MAG: antitoxin [Anaerolineaceae bacterium]|nr:antitoxin [Anaerolineaceae bacterium]
MDWQEHITIDPDVLVGKPIIKGTRLSVDFILGLLAQGWSESEILRNYPGITSANIRACLAYASETLRLEKIYPLASA